MFYLRMKLWVLFSKQEVSRQFWFYPLCIASWCKHIQTSNTFLPKLLTGSQKIFSFYSENKNKVTSQIFINARRIKIKLLYMVRLLIIASLMTHLLIITSMNFIITHRFYKIYLMCGKYKYQKNASSCSYAVTFKTSILLTFIQNYYHN